jgi:hypothetical protein
MCLSLYCYVHLHPFNSCLSLITQLGLEHMIRRVRIGDKNIQAKLAEHASKLEVKLTQANLMLAAKR